MAQAENFIHLYGAIGVMCQMIMLRRIHTPNAEAKLNSTQLRSVYKNTPEKKHSSVQSNLVMEAELLNLLEYRFFCITFCLSWEHNERIVVSLLDS